MATASAQSNERKCAVCRSDFVTPKILPCGHLLCQKCAIPLLESYARAVCPLNRCTLFMSLERLQFQMSKTMLGNPVDALPTDYTMEALVQSARILAKDPVCCYCVVNNKAEFICMQCLDMMCSSCHKIHQKMSMSHSHDVESLNTVTPERLAASGPPLCAYHGKKQSLFCQYHELTLCASCKDESHSQCQAVIELDDEMTSAMKSLDTLIDRLNKEEEELKQEIADMDKRIKEVDIIKDEDMAQIDEACNRLKTMVEIFRFNMKFKTKISHNTNMNILNSIKNTFGEQLPRVTSHKHILLRAKEVAPRPALIHMRKPLTRRVDSLKHEHYYLTTPRVGKSCEDKVREIEEMLRREWVMPAL